MKGLRTRYRDLFSALWRSRCQLKLQQRNAELVWLRKRRFLDLASSLVKCACLLLHHPEFNIVHSMMIPVLTMTLTYGT
jgi:hypothetical protein